MVGTLTVTCKVTGIWRISVAKFIFRIGAWVISPRLKVELKHESQS
jgi:hypothetical protein